MVDALEIGMWMHEVSDRFLEVVVWCSGERERWLPRLAIQPAVVVVRLRTPDTSQIVQIESFSWCQEWKDVLHDGVVLHVTP